jgi:glycosyltransferase involved in cell wall biosynthesis
MKVAHLSYSDRLGGAARAAFRLHRALVASGVDSKMYVANKVSDDYRVIGPRGRTERLSLSLRNFVADTLCRTSLPENGVMRSLGLTGTGLVSRAEMDRCDIVNLHWIGSETVALKEIGACNRPLVWRVADMWPFCGAEHYSDIGPSARWRAGYDKTPPGGKVRFDIDRFVWAQKAKYIPSNTHFVATTPFVAQCLRESALFKNAEVTVIPNTLDTRQYQPWPKPMARQLLNLPLGATLVLFGALGGSADPRKGWDFLKAALEQLERRMPGVEGVIFGQSEPAGAVGLRMPLHWVGHVNDDVTLSLLYSAADVMVVPSRQETFGQTASESQACGTPVVAFNTTGLADVVSDRETGYLAQPYSSDDLARGIEWVLENNERHESLSRAARNRAVALWSVETVVPQYIKVYEAAIASSN